MNSFNIFFCLAVILVGFVAANDCVLCDQSIKTCDPSCTVGQDCVVVPQTCKKCSFARCVQNNKDEKGSEGGCVICSKDEPKCPVCSTDKTCMTCATAACYPISAFPNVTAMVTLLASSPD
ncbi:hypothetical protein O9G_004618 [Rozella allomycis CSF55]|uniref:Membrane anchor Opy2 N-terminal domain-containing protein n=1 Tax=Rozella allomycis (strain CSF55) TaxID=988480 RepID=A0A075ARS0_ROZAC|nr:hypothetical protein O9G_004618 [Rozella allomycis CSF55]|eukprot:EPZ32938.1 hypothetical protein O9G_004618 [Rozella allomycis CSF55]